MDKMPDLEDLRLRIYHLMQAIQDTNPNLPEAVSNELKMLVDVTKKLEASQIFDYTIPCLSNENGDILLIMVFGHCEPVEASIGIKELRNKIKSQLQSFTFLTEDINFSFKQIACTDEYMWTTITRSKPFIKISYERSNHFTEISIEGLGVIGYINAKVLFTK